MFTMMNEARQKVGIPGVADRAYQQARDYAVSGSRAVPDQKSGDRVAIIQHPDVRRADDHEVPGRGHARFSPM